LLNALIEDCQSSCVRADSQIATVITPFRRNEANHQTDGAP
jgi:hypothetical protein